MAAFKTAHPSIHPVYVDHVNGGTHCARCDAEIPNGCYVFSEIKNGKLAGVEADENPQGPGDTVRHVCGSFAKGSV